VTSILCSSRKLSIKRFFRSIPFKKTSDFEIFYLCKTIIFTAMKRLCCFKTLRFKALKRLCRFKPLILKRWSDVSLVILYALSGARLLMLRIQPFSALLTWLKKRLLVLDFHPHGLLPSLLSGARPVISHLFLFKNISSLVQEFYQGVPSGLRMQSMNETFTSPSECPSFII
jgi:hypothetical protein